MVFSDDVEYKFFEFGFWKNLSIELNLNSALGGLVGGFVTVKDLIFG